MFSVYQHWDSLKVCAVGRSYPPEFYSYIRDARVRNVFEKIAEETEEDYQKLISKLEEFGVEVIRTDICEDLSIYWRTTGRKISPPPMTPRDFTAMVGSKFFMPGRRYGDNIDAGKILRQIRDGKIFSSLTTLKKYPLVAEYLRDVLLPGRPVDLSPNTILQLKNKIKERKFSQFILEVGYENIKELIIQSETNTIGSNYKFPNFKGFDAFGTIRKRLIEEGNEIVTDTYINSATMTRIGKDLYHGLNNIVSLCNKKHYLERWNNHLPGYRNNLVHLPGHNDGLFCPVKPGLIISIGKPERFKDTFPGWEVVHLPGESWDKVRPHMSKKGKCKKECRYWVPGEERNDAFHEYITEWYDHWVTYVEESVFDVNMLVIDEKNVICNNVNDKVFEAFERHGVTPHVINFRHRYFWDGGLHCITSDLHRDGSLNDYFPDRTESITFK